MSGGALASVAPWCAMSGAMEFTPNAQKKMEKFVCNNYGKIGWPSENRRFSQSARSAKLAGRLINQSIINQTHKKISDRCLGQIAKPKRRLRNPRVGL
jgi:hypothetical protein